MKTYTVHINPKAKRPQEDAVFVPEGFSFLMFIPVVNVAVAIYRRCWLLLLMMITIEIATYFAAEHYLFKASIAGSPLQLYMAMRLALLFFFGLWVNDFWRWKLEKRGYEFAGIVTARSTFHPLAEAEQRFYDKLARTAK